VNEITYLNPDFQSCFGLFVSDVTYAHIVYVNITLPAQHFTSTSKAVAKSL